MAAQLHCVPASQGWGKWSDKCSDGHHLVGQGCPFRRRPHATEAAWAQGSATSETNQSSGVVIAYKLISS
jgi:hypothetical protein